MSFTQTITVRGDDRKAPTDLLDDWHRDQAGTAPGYQWAETLQKVTTGEPEYHDFRAEYATAGS